jgi:hypothetical protein
MSPAPGVPQGSSVARAGSLVSASAGRSDPTDEEVAAVRVEVARLLPEFDTGRRIDIRLSH